MKHIKRFNESVEGKSTLTVREADELNHNIKGGIGEDYGFDENVVLNIDSKSECTGTYQGKKYEAFFIYESDTLGFIIKVDGEPKHLISIYEPHGCEINEKKGLITSYGHEQVIHLWLEDGEFDEIYTR